jgi:hypothetical protein
MVCIHQQRVGTIENGLMTLPSVTNALILAGSVKSQENTLKALYLLMFQGIYKNNNKLHTF